MTASSYTVDTDLDHIDLDTVHQWLSTEALWALGRSRDTVQRAAEGSLNFGLYNQAGRIVGYARVVTDYATFAWLCEVFIAPEERGHGAGRLLAQAVVDHLRLMHLKRVLLSTLDAHELYKKVGFAPFPDPHKLMQLEDQPAPSAT